MNALQALVDRDPFVLLVVMVVGVLAVVWTLAWTADWLLAKAEREDRAALAARER